MLQGYKGWSAGRWAGMVIAGVIGWALLFVIATFWLSLEGGK